MPALEQCGEEAQRSHAFHVALVREIPRLTAQARRLSGGALAAEDLVQATLLRAWEHRASLRDEASFQAWLDAIVRTSAAQERRRLRVRLEFEKSWEISAKSAATAGGGAIDLHGLVQSLETLSPSAREAVRLVYIEGLTCVEAAALCGCSASTLKSRLRRARATLARDLDVAASHGERAVRSGLDL
ncbi:MAG: RNA polymerase sigma factor [Hyphomicrobiaceae bacterium]